MMNFSWYTGNGRAIINPIESSPRAWYDSSDASTITESGELISQWSDKSGNDLHLVQSDDAMKPTYSVNEVVFDGSNDLMTAPGVLLTGGITVFIVFKPAIGYATAQLLSNQGSGAAKSRTYVKTNSIDFGNSELMFTAATEGVDNIVTAYSLQGDGVTQTGTINSTTVTGAVDRGTPSTNIAIGAFISGSAYFEGSIKEVLIYNEVLSLDFRQRINTYLSNKWGL